MVTSVLFWLGWIVYAVLVVSTATVVVLENRQPAKTIAWLIVLVLLPGLGLIIFYFFGQEERRRHILNRGNYAIIWNNMREAVRPTPITEQPKDYEPLIALLSDGCRAVVTGGNDVRLLPSGRDFLLSLLREIYAAREHIHIETYIIDDDAVGRLVRDALIDRLRDGVEVRFLYDDVGCWHLPGRFFRSMEQAGAQVFAFMPVRFPSLTRRVNYRNHRKVCVFDGRTGFIGGMNLALRYCPKDTAQWVDMQLRLCGECVGTLQQTFLSSWFFSSGRMRAEKRFFPVQAEQAGGSLVQVVSSTPISPFPEIMYAVTWMLQNARRYVYVMTPYFMPTEPVIQALQTAAMAGVDVRLMLPLKPDGFWLRWGNEAYFTDVLRAGIRIFLYDGGFLHAKALVMDDDCCTVGSSNMDFRSFENNFESNAIVYDAAVARIVREQFDAALAHCHEVREQDWDSRSWGRRYIESVTRIFSPLL